MLKSVVSVANIEQSSVYPPGIFDSHYNIVTSFILDYLAKNYPVGTDIGLPFFKYQRIPVTNGYIQLPEEYRNMLGAPSINLKPDGTDCSDPIIIDTAREFELAKLKGGCKTYFLEMVSKSEWDARTSSSYAFPTSDKPIGLFIGDRRIKVCPYNISNVEVAFFRREKIYRYGYIMQPDDTYIYDVTTSVESEWTDSAASLLTRGCFALYSAYSKDPSAREFSQVLNQAGLF